MLHFDKSRTPKSTFICTTYLSSVQASEYLNLVVRPFAKLPFLSFGCGGDLTLCYLYTQGIYDGSEYEQKAFSPNFQTCFYGKIASEIPFGSWKWVLGGEAGYIGMAGAKDGDLWMNVLGTHQFNGFTYKARTSLLWHGKNWLRKAGFRADMGGYFYDGNLDERYKNFNGTFVKFHFTPTTTRTTSRF